MVIAEALDCRVHAVDYEPGGAFRHGETYLRVQRIPVESISVRLICSASPSHFDDKEFMFVFRGFQNIRLIAAVFARRGERQPPAFRNSLKLNPVREAHAQVRKRPRGIRR